jgi:hypothetical protein
VKSLAEDPAFYVMCVCGAGAFLLFATALQQSKVTVVQSAMVLGQTVIPAIVGVLVLGDRPRHGFMIVALVGFLCAIGGALVLARFEAREDTVAQARRTVEKGLAEETAEGTANAEAALGQTGPPPAIEDRKPPAAGGAALGRRRVAHGEPDTPPASR